MRAPAWKNAIFIGLGRYSPYFDEGIITGVSGVLPRMSPTTVQRPGLATNRVAQFTDPSETPAGQLPNRHSFQPTHVYVSSSARELTESLKGADFNRALVILPDRSVGPNFTRPVQSLLYQTYGDLRFHLSIPRSEIALAHELTKPTDIQEIANDPNIRIAIMPRNIYQSLDGSKTFDREVQHLPDNKEGIRWTNRLEGLIESRKHVVRNETPLPERVKQLEKVYEELLELQGTSSIIRPAPGGIPTVEESVRINRWASNLRDLTLMADADKKIVRFNQLRTSLVRELFLNSKTDLLMDILKHRDSSKPALILSPSDMHCNELGAKLPQKMRDELLNLTVGRGDILGFSKGKYDIFVATPSDPLHKFAPEGTDVYVMAPYTYAIANGLTKFDLGSPRLGSVTYLAVPDSQEMVELRRQ